MRRLAAFLFFLGSAAPSQAAFQEPILSPRSAALGNISVAAADDSAGIFLNPAGIARLPRPECYFMRSGLYAGLDGIGEIGTNLIAAGVPTRWGSFGLGYGSFRASGLMEERTMAFTVARKLPLGVQLGVSANWLQHSFSPQGEDSEDPVFRGGTSRSALGLDFGAVYPIAPGFDVGFSVKNFNRPDVGLASEDRVARQWRAAVAFPVGGRVLTVTTELAVRGATYPGGARRVLPTVGLQKRISGVWDAEVLFRIGVNPDEITSGFGIQKGRMGVDYALVLNRNLLGGSVGSHLIGVRLLFGGVGG